MNVSLDTCDLTSSGLHDLALRMSRLAIPRNTIANCLSAMRAYARMDTPLSEVAPVNGSGRAVAGAHATRSPDLGGLHPDAGEQRSNSIVAPDDEPGVDAWPTADPAVAPAERPDFITSAGVRDLLVIYDQVMGELRARDVIRTGNSPVGDYAELLFARAFGWSLEPNSSAGYDAKDAAGVTYQIKARRLGHPTSSRQLSAIRRLHTRSFEYLAAVLFDSAFTVTRAIFIPYEVVVARAKHVEHTNSWRFMLEDNIWKQPGIIDVTATLSVAASKI